MVIATNTNSFIVIVIIFVIVFMALMMLIGFFVMPKLEEKLSPVAVQQGYKNAFLTLLLLLPIFVVAVLLVKFIFNLPINIAVPVTYAFIWGGMCLFLLYIFATRKKKAGRILLDIGPVPTKNMLILVGCLFSVLGFSGSYSFGLFPGTVYAYYFSIAFGLSLGVNNLAMAFSRMQICENGILLFVDLLKWEKIEAFAWGPSDEKILALKLSYKGHLPAFMRKGVLSIPVAKKDEVAAILENYSSKMSLIATPAG